MARGITGINFEAEDLETGQIKEYPILKNCKVYGVMANSLTAYIAAEMMEKSRQNSEKLQKDGYKYSGIKWIYGKVNSLEKGGIQWFQWFNDANRNNKQDPGEENIQNKPLKEISGTDVYEVGGSYNLANPISLWFDKDEKFAPALYWIEPFLIHPELHFGKNPKGLFIIPIQHPGPYEVVISCEKHIKREQLTQILASTVEQAKYTYLYYGENIEFFIETLQIPEGEKIEVRIEEESSNQTLYTATATVKKNKPAQEGEESDELQDYLNQFKGFADVSIPLDISKMPENQRKKEARVFKVQITYFPSDYSLFNEMGSVVAASNLPSVIISSRGRKEMANKPIIQSLTGYIQIMYEDTETYISTRNTPVNKVVEREAESLVAPGVEPCHYTQIKAQRYKDVGFSKKDGEEATIFDETKRVLPNSQPKIEVIAGDAKPAFLKLMADLHTNEACRPGTHTRGGKNVFYFHEEASAAQQNLTVVDIKEKEIDLSLSYIYIKDKKVAKLVSTFPFNYFWLTEKDKQPYVVMIETCRYKNDVEINVYPDIEWELAFTFALENPLAYTHSGKKPGYIFYEAQEKARKSGYDRMQLSRGGAVPFEFSLSLKNAYNGGIVKNEYALQYSKKLKDTLGIFTKLKEMADKVKKFTGGAAKKIPGQPAFSFEVQSPVLGAMLSWKNEEEEGKVASTGTVSFIADPLLGAEFTIDLLAVGSRMHPVVKVIERGIRLGLDLLGGYLILEAQFYGTLEITIEAFKFNYKGASFSQQPAMIKGKMGVMFILDLKVKGTIENPIWDVEMEFAAEAKVNAYFGGTAKLGYDEKGLYADCTGKFSGLIFSAKIEIKINGYTRKAEVNNTIWESDEVPLGKAYLINSKS